MPTKRTKITPKRIAISPAAIEAWRIGDFAKLVNALDLKLYDPTPWPLERCALGCDQGPCPTDARGKPLWSSSGWSRAQELQRALLEIAGPPGEMDRHGRPLGPSR
jgi:hypothetical protein